MAADSPWSLTLGATGQPAIVIGSVAVVVALVAVAGVKRSFWTNSNPVVVGVDPDDPIPPMLDRAVDAHAPSLERLGFLRAGALACVETAGRFQLVAVAFANAKERSAALVAHVGQFEHSAGRGAIVFEKTYIEFSTALADGSVLATNNHTDYPFGPREASYKVLVLPRRDPDTLWRVHRGALAERGPREPLLQEDWWITEMVHSLSRFNLRCVRHGYLHAARDGRHRLTWKGAVMATLTGITPLKQAWTWWNGREARAILSRVGHR